MATTIEIRDRGLLLEMLTVGHAVLVDAAVKLRNDIQVERLDRMLETVRRQLYRPWKEKDVRRPLRPPVATTHA